jgi:hypothetical protein
MPSDESDTVSISMELATKLEIAPVDDSLVAIGTA